MARLGKKAAAPAPPTGPVLDLSGPRLRQAFNDLVAGSEATGGVERYVTALALKASLFEELLGHHAADLTETEFLDLAAFVTPVRRKIGQWLGENGFDRLHAPILHLVRDTAPVDQRMADFCAAFPPDKAHRWVRDLAAEILHFTDPEHCPLMARWVWDARVGTGVLREIWHAEDVDAARINVADDLATFATLRMELEGFLASEGVFRDLHFYADMLMAHVYAGYINDRGGQYLRSDFTTDGAPMMHTRRMLGLDAVDTETGRTRLRLIDGSAHVLGGEIALAPQEARDAHS